jgi:hypothetical protein
MAWFVCVGTWKGENVKEAWKIRQQFRIVPFFRVLREWLWSRKGWFHIESLHLICK